MYDVIVIGAGVSGAASARELSRYQLKIAVLEKEEDVCSGTSKANSAIVHAGYDAAEGSLMAKLNVKGNRMMTELSKELDFPFLQNGSLVVCTREEDRPMLRTLLERGVKNGVEGLRIIEREELREMEPNISEDAVAALYAPTGGIVCPFNLTIALSENAYTNGVEFHFNTEVQKMEKLPEGGFRIHTNQGEYKTRCIVNAAGVHADEFHNMMSSEKIEIIPRRGDYCLLDKSVGKHVSHTIFALPSKFGKGILVTPTVHGNLLVGPNAVDIEDKDGTNTTREGLQEILAKSAQTVKNIPYRSVITSFSGLRAHWEGHEFVIKELPEAPGFVDCLGIESPGLTSAPAIGVMVADIVHGILKPEKNPSFVGSRKGVLNPAELSLEERDRLIQEKPAYGTIVCRCEMVTEGEILDAIHRPLGARSLDGIKRRTRAGMGRCQAGFCSPKSMAILARELEIDMSAVTKCGGASKFIVGSNKDRL